MAFDPFVAIRFTSYYAHRTNWPDHLGKTFGVFGFHTRNPTALEFVTAVRDWQLGHPPLKADGLLGPQTWNELLPVVRAYTGVVPVGTCPDWVSPVTPGQIASVTYPPPSAVVIPIADSGEGRTLQTVIDKWLSIGGRLEANPYVAVPVSNEYVSGSNRESLPSLPTKGICGVLWKGEVWSGLTGSRIIVGLSATAVVFVTDSGQAYYQTVEAWNSDYLAGVYTGVIRSLVPLQTLREEEIQQLIDQLQNAIRPIR